MPEQRPSSVLIVEDEARIAEFLAKGLRADDHQVVVAEDGDVALFLVTAELFDVVVLDLGLPGASGLDVLRGIRAHHPSLPVLVLTGRDDPASRRACLAAGAAGFITKPLVFGELRSAIAAQQLGEGI
jgi:DNA-binding response OmpR family regulator